MSRNKEHRGAAEGGAPNGAGAFLLIYFLYYENLWIFLIYFIFICPKSFPYKFPCVYLKNHEFA